MIFILFLGLSVSVFSQEVGVASYYAKKFQGRKTASGLIHDNDDYVAAHKKLPFGTFVRVTNLSNNMQVVVRITDRGPFRGRRVIDLSRSAAEKIGMVQRGIAKVKIDVIGNPSDLNVVSMIAKAMEPVELKPVQIVDYKIPVLELFAQAD